MPNDDQAFRQSKTPVLCAFASLREAKPFPLLGLIVHAGFDQRQDLRKILFAWPRMEARSRPVAAPAKASRSRFPRHLGRLVGLNSRRLQERLQVGSATLTISAKIPRPQSSSLGKKNYLFIGDVGAGQRSATLFSLLGSCLRRGVNPRAYMRWLMDRLPEATNLTVRGLTPAAYAALHGVETAKAA
jgi:hypothetical protein